MDRGGIYNSLHRLNERQVCEMRDWITGHSLSNAYTAYVMNLLCGLMNDCECVLNLEQR